MADIPPPPPGFTLDSAVPPPPAGFTIDQPSAAAAVPPPPAGFKLDAPTERPGLLGRINEALSEPARRANKAIGDFLAPVQQGGRPEDLPPEAQAIRPTVTPPRPPEDPAANYAARAALEKRLKAEGKDPRQDPEWQHLVRGQGEQFREESRGAAMFTPLGIRAPRSAAARTVPEAAAVESRPGAAAERPLSPEPIIPSKGDRAPAAAAIEIPRDQVTSPAAAGEARPPGAPSAATPAPAPRGQAPAPPAGGGGQRPPPVDPPGSAPPAPPASPARRALDTMRQKARDALEVGADLWTETKKATAPMAVGSVEARAVAKDFANDMRLAQYEGTRSIEQLTKEFKPDELRAMWQAADADSVALQKGAPAVAREALAPKQREAVARLQDEAQANWETARQIGLVEGEGLPSYTPRMVVQLAGDTATAAGGTGAGKTVPGRIGRNLSTTSGNLRRRKYGTVDETEAAARASVGPGAAVVQDIRTLALANQKLQQAIAGRTLVNQIKQAGSRAGEPVVWEGAKPNEPGWFTIDHPALQTWRPKLERDEATGAARPLRDASGEIVFERVPIYIRSDFEGPLRAVLSQEPGKVYGALMDMKARTMGVVMYSPLIHNAVEWGRALPAMPGKVASFRVYFEGNAAKRNPEVMREAIKAGVTPIGHRAQFQDITSIAQGAQLEPGRSWTSQVLAAVPGLFDRNAGTAVKRAIDRAGDVWHNTLLWDRVGDLQMGLYTNLRDHYIAKGVDAQSAQRMAAHFANRYAGALPVEAMSTGARKVANLLLFSRQFTLGNLGAMKDMVKGLPLDVQSQILRDKGVQALMQVQGEAKRKAISTIMLDIGLMYLGNTALQSAIAVLTGDKTLDEEGRGYARRLNRVLQEVEENPTKLLNPFWGFGELAPMADNEPGKKDRVLVGYADDGTAIYMRNPAGKIGEEFQGWLTDPFDMVRRKMGTVARPLAHTIANRDDFGQRIYNPHETTPAGWLKNIGKIVWAFMSDQVPSQAIKAARDQLAGRGDTKTNVAQIVGPLAGFTFSKGAPGGPEVGEMYRARELHDMEVKEAMPRIRDLIKDGKLDEARDLMTGLKIPTGLQNYYIVTTKDPSRRMTARQMRTFNQTASPDQRENMERLRAEREHRQAPGAP